MTVEMDPPREKRILTGFVSQFTQVGTLAWFLPLPRGSAPWLWFLTRTSDCRIYQQMKVPDIVKEIFRDHSFTDFEDKLNNSYRSKFLRSVSRDGFHFVSRLLGTGGPITTSGTKLVSIRWCYATITAPTVRSRIRRDSLYPPSQHGSSRWRDYVYDWKLTKSVQPGRYAHNDYDFTKPKADLHTNAPLPRRYDHADYEDIRLSRRVSGERRGGELCTQPHCGDPDRV